MSVVNFKRYFFIQCKRYPSYLWTKTHILEVACYIFACHCSTCITKKEDPDLHTICTYSFMHIETNLEILLQLNTLHLTIVGKAVTLACFLLIRWQAQNSDTLQGGILWRWVMLSLAHSGWYPVLVILTVDSLKSLDISNLSLLISVGLLLTMT